VIPALGRHLFESTAFALFAAALALAFRKRGAATRHLLCFIALVKFAIPVAALSALGLKFQNSLPHSVVAPRAFVGLTSFLTYQLPQTQRSTAQSTQFDLLIAVWLVVACAMLIVWLRKLFASSQSSDSVDDHMLSRLKEGIGLRKKVHIRLSPANFEPALIGFWRPVVTIPDTLAAKLSKVELEAVILHELAHAKRLDNWTGAFAHVLTCIFWFYPLLWWMERRLYLERERACDEIVVRSGVAPRDYVDAILKVCRFHLAGRAPGVSAVSSSNLKKRMEVIMSLSRNTQAPHIPKLALVGLIAAMTVVPVTIGFLWARAANGQTANPANQTSKQIAGGRTMSCVFASVEYPEGTVIQEEGGPEQLCARVLSPATTDKAVQYAPQWIHTSKAIRERSKKIVHLSRAY
jgi:beta-lactamase regulating signal transducer with metallopeptidase domain